MNTRRNWTQVTVAVVLALASLSSIAMSAPHHDRLVVLADLCDVAAIKWAEQGGPVPEILTVNCVENSPVPIAAAEEALPLFEQYQAAREELWEAYLNGTDQAPSTVSAAEKAVPIFDQYQDAAEEYREAYLNGIDQAPSTVSAAEKAVPIFDQYQDAAEEYWEAYLNGTD